MITSKTSIERKLINKRAKLYKQELPRTIDDALWESLKETDH
jgi:hypothetical protein